MKRYLRLSIFFAVAAAAVSAAYLVRVASSPMSSIIAKQRDGLFLSRDKGRAENDPAYARELEERLRFLDYRRALALNAEKQARCGHRRSGGADQGGRGKGKGGHAAEFPELSQRGAVL